MKELLRVIGIFAGGLSLFRISSYLWNLELSAVMSQIVAFYGELLNPVRVVLEPILRALLEQIKWELPDWWIHILVIWLFIGGVTVRGLDVVDQKTGQASEKSTIWDAISSVMLSFFGIFLLVGAVGMWVVFGLIMKQDGIDVKEARGFSPYRVLAREMVFGLLSFVGFLCLNAFV